MSSPQDKRPVAVTMGDPGGIGLELIERIWLEREVHAIPPFMVIADADLMRAINNELQLGISFSNISSPQQALETFENALPVLHQDLGSSECLRAEPNPEAAKATLASIETAVALALSDQVAAIVTNPIHKSSLKGAGFKFPGHTEFLAHLTSTKKSVMMLAIEGLRVVPVTIHMGLMDVAKALTTDAIVETTTITHLALQTDFGIATPRLAMAALNPHAGEDGQFGKEERAIIQPACEVLRAQGVDVSDPLPADTVFSEDVRQAYDAVICMYHDQALIPLKTLDFYGGVNVTLGLPITRTSPDHGTAFNLVGKGTARTDSLVAALRMANDLASKKGTA